MNKLIYFQKKKYIYIMGIDYKKKYLKYKNKYLEAKKLYGGDGGDSGDSGDVGFLHQDLPANLNEMN